MANAPRYEDSPADKANDRKAAKALGKTVAEFEGSAQDAVMDAQGQAALSRAAANAAGPDIPAQSPPQGVQSHKFAHKRPLA